MHDPSCRSHAPGHAHHGDLCTPPKWWRENAATCTRTALSAATETPSSTSTVPSVTAIATGTPEGEGTTLPISSTRTITYTYAGVQELTGAVESPGSSFAYTYDQVGNRTSVTVDGTQTAQYTYNAANEVSNAGWTYDAAGNLTTDGTATYAYDALGRLTGTTAGSDNRNYAYDGDGTLVSATVDGRSTGYTQDLAGSLSQILGMTSGGVASDYLYGADCLSALNGSTRTWYGTDTQGSVRQTIDDGGNVLAGQSYDPYGSPETSGQVGIFGYTGELQDSGTNAEYLRARWCQPATGTLLGVDPELDSTGQAYAYAGDDPVNGSDPSGLCTYDGGLGLLPGVDGDGSCEASITNQLTGSSELVAASINALGTAFTTPLDWLLGAVQQASAENTTFSEGVVLTPNCIKVLQSTPFGGYCNGGFQGSTAKMALLMTCSRFSADSLISRTLTPHHILTYLALGEIAGTENRVGLSLEVDRGVVALGIGLSAPTGEAVDPQEQRLAYIDGLMQLHDLLDNANESAKAARETVDQALELMEKSPADQALAASIYSTYDKSTKWIEDNASTFTATTRSLVGLAFVLNLAEFQTEHNSWSIQVVASATVKTGFDVGVAWAVGYGASELCFAAGLDIVAPGCGLVGGILGGIMGDATYKQISGLAFDGFQAVLREPNT